MAGEVEVLLACHSRPGEKELVEIFELWVVGEGEAGGEVRARAGGGGDEIRLLRPDNEKVKVKTSWNENNMKSESKVSS